LFVLWFCAFVVALLAVALLYQSFGQRKDRLRFPPPGQLVTTPTGRSHVFQSGNGSPAVVLEAGISGSSVGWTVVQRHIAEFTRVLSYDRAGLGWSDAIRKPRTLSEMATHLGLLLEASGVTTPVVLVGHSFGSLVLRAYAFAHPEQVAGLVLVDPVSVSVWANAGEVTLRRLATGVRLSRRGAVLARFGVVRAALGLLTSGRRLLPQAINRTTARQGGSTVTRLIGEVRKLPPETWPVIQSHWSSSKSFQSMADHLECLPESALAAQAMPIPSSIPVVILSAGTATADEIRERDEWLRSHPRARHLRVPDTTHWLHLERPDLVVECVRSLVDDARQNSTPLT
jgi:pimeloyl-ACP methyl ester carboxylesterase